MLYQTTINPEPTLDETYLIDPGSQHCFPFTLGAEEAKNVLVIHAVGNQDHSLRVWISRAPGDTPVVQSPHFASFWHANRNDQEYITVFDEDSPIPGLRSPLGLPTGDYTVNILNLVNRQNVYSFTLTDYE
jgi:hypothetical protein